MIRKIKDSFFKAKTEQSLDVIIHIGAPKTGSSAIQDFLLDSKKQLEKYGFYYPLHGKDINNISGGHSNIGLSLINDEYEKAKKLYDTYLNEAKQRDCTLLLSAESFYNHASKFKKIVGQESIKVVVFQRDPLESLFSNYNQGVKRHFQIASWPNYCKKILAQKQTPSLSGYLVEEWQQLFSTENVIVQKYDKKSFAKTSIQEIFLDLIGMQKYHIETLKPEKNRIVNKSYSIVALELKRILNYVLDKNNPKRNNEIDWYLQSYSDEKDESVMPYFELSKKLITNLEEKFDTKIDIALKNSFTVSKRLQNILKLTETIKKEKPKLSSYISECIRIYIEANDFLSYDIRQLCGWFDIYISTVNEKLLWFHQNQLQNMATGKYEEADYLRDIATLLLDREDMQNADKIITRALTLRPKGPMIIKIKEQIMELK